MKSELVNFFTSNQMLALATAVGVFLLTILLIAKKWIGFAFGCILLLSAVAAAVLINNPRIIEDGAWEGPSPIVEGRQEEFKKQVMQAIDLLQQEVKSEKENMQHLTDQVQDIFTKLDSQKQKLETFIEETREKFQSEKEEKPKI